jgi:hypothetical protein
MIRLSPVERAAAQAVLRGFAGIALTCVALLAVSGLYLSGQLVASVDALLISFYGRTLILKTFLVLLVGLAGLLNSASLHEQVARPIRWVLRRPTGWTPFALRGLRHTVLLEASLAACVLLSAAALGAAQPARGPVYDAALPDGLVASQISAKVSDLIMTFSVKPDRPGQNFIALGVFDTRRPAPAPIEQVLVRFRSPNSAGGDLTAVAEPLGEGHYQITGGVFDRPGDWTITVTVKRPGMLNTVLTVPWTVLPSFQAGQSRPVIVSNQSMAPALNAAALALILIAASIAVGLRLAGRQARHQPASQQE